MPIAAVLLAAPAAAADDAVAGHDPLPSRAGDFSLKIEPGVV